MATAEQIRKAFKGRIRNLVFEGGGVWGIAYEGALLELESYGALDDLRRVGGASAGAITAALSAVGYTPGELGALLRQTDFKSFEDHDTGLGRDTARLLTEFGWYKGDAFKEWMRDRMRSKIGRLVEEHGVACEAPSPTFAQLGRWRAKLAAKGVRLPEPFLIGSNLTRQRREVYSSETSPNLRVDEAARRSMSIPLFFACARGAAKGDKRDVIVDGGLTWNYPVNLFDHERYVVDPKNAFRVAYDTSAGFVFNTETLGFRVDTTQELEFNLAGWANEPEQIDNIVDYSRAMLVFIRAIANKVHLHSNDWARTVFVDVGEKIPFTAFDLTKDDQQFLSDRGRAGVRKYADWLASADGKAELKEILAKVKA